MTRYYHVAYRWWKDQESEGWGEVGALVANGFPLSLEFVRGHIMKTRDATSVVVISWQEMTYEQYMQSGLAEESS